MYALIVRVSEEPTINFLRGLFFPRRIFFTRNKNQISFFTMENWLLFFKLYQNFLLKTVVRLFIFSSLRSWYYFLRQKFRDPPPPFFSLRVKWPFPYPLFSTIQRLHVCINLFIFTSIFTLFFKNSSIWKCHIHVAIWPRLSWLKSLTSYMTLVWKLQFLYLLVILRRIVLLWVSELKVMMLWNQYTIRVLS